MPDPLTLSVVLIPIAESLVAEGLIRRFDALLGRTPVQKAIKATSEVFNSRCAGLQTALESWVQSEKFKREMENLAAGNPSRTEAEHIDAFVSESGLHSGIIGFEVSRDILLFFYGRLYDEVCLSSQGPRLIGGQLLSVGRQLDEVLDRLSPKNAVVPESSSAGYAARPELDTTARGTTSIDAEAETQLNIVRQLLDSRKALTALEILNGIQPKVDQGILSPPVRFRFFINKGVCHMVCSEPEVAIREFERALTLEPNNPKALINMAQAAHVLDDPARALGFTARILATDQNDPNANALRLACLHETGQDEEVDKEVAATTGLLAHSAVLYTLAYIAFDRERFAEAEHYLRCHNEKDQNYASAWELLGRAIMVPAQRVLQEQSPAPNLIPQPIRERIQEAEECFCKAEQLLLSSDSKRELAAALANRGTTRMLLSRFDDARRDFERALEIQPALDEVKQSLGSLYLFTGKAEEAIRVFRSIADGKLNRNISLQTAAAYLDFQKPSEARRILEEALRDAGTEGILLKDLLLIACFRLSDLEACESIAGNLEAESADPPESHRVLAQHWLRVQQPEKALTAMRRAVDLSPDSRKPRYRLLLAEMLYRVHQFAEATIEYELVPVLADESDDCGRYVGALYNAGRLSKALQVAQSVRGQRPAIPVFSEVEALIYEQSGDLATATGLRKALLEIDESPARQRLKIASNLVRQGQTAAARTLVEKVKVGDIADAKELLFDSGRLRTILEMPDALEFAHRLLQIDFENPEAHLFFTSTFFQREKIDEPLLRPSVVERHSTVFLRHGADIQKYTLVDGNGSPANGQLGSSHELATALNGKRVGDVFRFPQNRPAESEYEVTQIQSKYVFAFQDCLSHFNERFPAHEGLSRVEVNTNDPTIIVKMLEGHRQRADRALEFYKAGSLPACTIARLLGRSDEELFFALIADPSMRILSSSGVGAELQAELLKLAPVASVILEASALVTLETLGLLPRLKERFGSVQVTQQTLDSIRETAINIHPEKQVGHMFSDKSGRIQMVEETATQAAEAKGFFERIAEFLRLSAEVVAPASVEALADYERQGLQKTIGKAAASTVCSAGASGVTMYSDDLALRQVAHNEQKVRSFWTQTLVRDLLNRQLITQDEYHDAVLKLAGAGYHFVSVTSADILWGLRRDAWNPTHDTTRAIASLAGPEADAGGAISIALDVLHSIWSDPLPAQSRHAIVDLVMQALITARNIPAVVQTMQKRNATRTVIWTKSTGEIQQSIEAWDKARRSAAVLIR